MIQVLLDADCAIYATTGQMPLLRERLSDCAPGEVGLSAISYAEIVLGMEQGKPPTPEALAALIEVVPVQAFDDKAADAYAKLPFKRARFDRLLAAHALSIGAVVVTNNEADFADVPGLVVENWTV
ncbi:MAG: type II toxin-antitoxin system VapC family toxin [Pseudomonadota bacterium]|nr:type II toxin-antitoxin system VapC family toxin [Pseudomonadota bacterium]